MQVIAFNRAAHAPAPAPVPSRLPFHSFRGNLERQQYWQVSAAIFVKGDGKWPDHYRARGRDQHGDVVDLRICAHSGDVIASKAK